MVVGVLGDPATVRALRLAGLEGRVVAESERPEPLLDEMLEVEDVGVILVTEPVAARMRERLAHEKLARRFPLVIEIPARGTAPEPVDELVSRVARLVGVKA